MPRAQRRCRHQGCDELQPCKAHARAPDTRPPSSQRGYDADYEAYRRSAEYISATTCGSCGKGFHPNRRKTIGHRVDIRAGGTSADGFFPQCHKCNYGWRRQQ